MRRIFESIFPFTLVLVIFTIPFPRATNNLAIALHVISWLFYFQATDLKYLKKNQPGILGIILLALFGLGLLYTENLYEGKRSIESLAPFLIFPVTLAGVTRLHLKFKEQIPKIFNGIVLFASFTALLIALIRTVNKGLYHTNPENMLVQNNFFYDRLSYGIGVHPGYLSLFVAFSILILITQLVDKTSSRKSKILIGIQIAFLLVVFILLKSAMVAIVLGICLIVFFVFFLPNNSHGKTKRYTVYAILLIILTSVFVISSKVDLNKKLFTYDKTKMPPHWNSVNLRLALFDVGWEASIAHLPFGVGTGDGEDVLKTYYKEQGFEYAIMHHYHPHNQFLFTFLMLGLPGLLVLLYFFYASIKSARKSGNALFIFLVILMIGFSLTEIPLSRNKSLVFFMVFLNYFEYLRLTRHKETTETRPSS